MTCLLCNVRRAALRPPPIPSGVYVGSTTLRVDPQHGLVHHLADHRGVLEAAETLTWRLIRRVPRRVGVCVPQHPLPPLPQVEGFLDFSTALL